MANYIAMARSNYFRVKDVEAFKKRFHGMQDMEVIEDSEGGVGLMCNGESAWPSDLWDDEKDEYVGYDFIEDLRTHLADGETCVLFEIGYEKMRYLVGVAFAFQNKGELLQTTLQQIYDEAEKHFGKRPTPAEY
jgi:hypothetical protein